MIRSSVGQPEISKTEGVPTAALLRSVAHCGVTVQGLKNEVHQGFLPGPTAGVWSPLAVTRAKRLYRLRRRGAAGKNLKMLLFIADGWGWDGIMDTCVAGIERMVRMSLNGVERYARAKGDLDLFVEEIAEHQHKALIKKVGDQPDLHPTSNETTAFYVGLLRGGEPLKGGTSRRISEPLLKAAFPGIPDRIVDYAVTAVDFIATALDMRLERQLERLRNATPEQVEHARLKFRENLASVRWLTKRMAGKEIRGHSLNSLTFFGNARRMDEINLSQGDVKLSPTFLLAGFLGISIALDIAYSDFLNRLPPWLSQMMR
ncbi:MAG: hypothetical protein ACYCX6_02105 [Vulcanimicrobiaceae bacterium]